MSVFLFDKFWDFWKLKKKKKYLGNFSFFGANFTDSLKVGEIFQIFNIKNLLLKF